MTRRKADTQESGAWAAACRNRRAEPKSSRATSSRRSKYQQVVDAEEAPAPPRSRRAAVHARRRPLGPPARGARRGSRADAAPARKNLDAPPKARKPAPRGRAPPAAARAPTSPRDSQFGVCLGSDLDFLMRERKPHTRRENRDLTPDNCVDSLEVDTPGNRICARRGSSAQPQTSVGKGERRAGLRVARIDQVVDADAEQPHRAARRPRCDRAARTARAAISSASRVGGVWLWLRVIVVKSE